MTRTGIVEIVEAAQAALPEEPIQLVVGGFHLLDRDEAAIRSLARDLRQRLGVRRVAPGHCTGEIGLRVFREVFGADCACAGPGTRLGLASDGGGQ